MTRSSKSVFVATDRPFWLDDRGDRQRIAALCRFLRKHGMAVHVFYVHEAGQPGADTEQCREWGFASLDVVFRRTGARDGMVSRLLRSLSGRTALSVAVGGAGREWREPTLASFSDKRVRARFEKACRRLRPDVVIIEYIRLAYLLKDRHPTRGCSPFSILDAHDVMSERARAFHEAGERHWVSVSAAEEAHALRACDVIMAIQGRDAERLHRLVSDRRVIVAGHACAIDPLDQPDDRPFNILYLGAQGGPNRRAVLRFLEAIWPAVRGALGDNVKLTIAGQICDKLKGKICDEQVCLLGYVNDVRPVYQRAHLVINPVAFGGGLKIKNVEALCFGMPLVTTPVGGEGMEDGAGTAFAICRDDVELRNTIIELFRNPDQCRDLRREALSFAERNFTEDAAYGELGELLSS